MKRMCIKMLVVSVMCAVSTAMAAAVYSPATVPNPKLQGQDCYVSNPDTILSVDDVAYLNRCSQLLEDTADVELAVVVLGSIGEYEPFDFGFELFQRWGIGKAGKNTGVLITFALASRQVYINTGTGIEGVLTDALCKWIIENDMIPLFKQGDYGGGLCAASTHIYRICSHGEAPEELMNMVSATNRGQFASSSGTSSGSDDEDFGALGWIILSAIVFFTLLPFLLIVLIQRKDTSIADEMDQRNGCLGWMIIFCIIFPFLIPSVVWFWHRSKRYRCPQCGKQRYKVIKTVKTPLKNGNKNKTETWLCSSCGYTKTETSVIKAFTSSGGSYSSGSSYDYDSGSSYDSSSSSSGSWGGGSSSGGGAGGSW